MLNLPFFSELERSQRVLLAGAGGGYDIFSGLPLYFGLRSQGKKAYLANLSFSVLPEGEERISSSLVKVTADTPGHRSYFPEKYLSQWFREREGEEIPIYCFERTGVKPLLASYQTLVEHLAVDTVILVDGGTDSLMRGDEVGLGTPHEDIASIAAVDELDVARKMMVCLGFGVDHYHGVCHAHFLEAIAQLTQNGNYLGMFSLLEEMPEVKKYRTATEAVFQKMPYQISIVSSSILSALAGHYGDYHATPRTKGSKLWINPLMPVYWCFQLDGVARRVLYLEAIKQTEHYWDLYDAIAAFRRDYAAIRPWEDIPV